MSRDQHSRSPAKNAPQNHKKSSVGKVLDALIYLLLFSVFLVSLVRFGAVDAVLGMLNGSGKNEGREFSLYQDAGNLCGEAEAYIADVVRNRDPVYVIPIDTFEAPVPDPSKYDEAFENYEDKTIEVHYHKERLHESWFHYAEIRIKHPSQFRMALADNQFGKKRRTPSRQARQVNAVVAVNGCFYNRRPFGFLMHRGQILLNKPAGLDVLLIDSEGNFHIIRDEEVMSSGVLEKNEMVSAVAFGPQLVKDGQAMRITSRFWQPDTTEPRTAICQYEDDLHYLICIGEGRNTESKGITMQTFADELAKTGVKTAYNLDGGQSGTLIIGNHRKNRIGWSSKEKAQGDILYFATALEENERG